MEPKIERHPAFRIVGMKVHGKNEHGEIPKMWGEFAARVAEVQDRAEQNVTYGVSANYAETGEFDYVAGIHVNPTADVPSGMVSWDVPAATYAVFSCPFQAIGPTYGYIWGEWLQSGAYEQDMTKLGFDYFPPGTGEGDSPIEIWFPVKETN